MGEGLMRYSVHENFGRRFYTELLVAAIPFENRFKPVEVV